MSTDALEQVSFDSLAGLDLRPRAVIRLHRSDLPASVTFRDGEDDLDSFEAAALQIVQKPVGRLGVQVLEYATHLSVAAPDVREAPLTFLLLRYRKEPQGQLTLLLPGDMRGYAAVRSAVRRVVAALNAPPDIDVEMLAEAAG